MRSDCLCFNGVEDNTISITSLCSEVEARVPIVHPHTIDISFVDLLQNTRSSISTMIKSSGSRLLLTTLVFIHSRCTWLRAAKPFVAILLRQ